jgi:ribosomal protein L40E
MTVEAGIVCGACDWLNPPDRSTCKECDNALSLLCVTRPSGSPEEVAEKPPESRPDIEKTPPKKAAQQETEEKPMEQARHYICKSCSSPVPSGHKFCGKCGMPGENQDVNVEPEYFPERQS